MTSFSRQCPRGGNAMQLSELFGTGDRGLLFPLPERRQSHIPAWKESCNFMQLSGRWSVANKWLSTRVPSVRIGPSVRAGPLVRAGPSVPRPLDPSRPLGPPAPWSIWPFLGNQPRRLLKHPWLFCFVWMCQLGGSARWLVVFLCLVVSAGWLC